jgi:hypothetical protein
VVFVRSLAQKYQSIDFNFPFEFLCVDGCREKLVSFLSHRIKRLEGSWFKLLSCSDFSNAPTRCSVKFLLGYKLFFDLIFIIDLARGHVSIISCFR